MSVLIKGIEMPREKKTTLTIFPDGRVYKNNGERLWGHGKDCIPWKAVPVPPHDGEAFEKVISERITQIEKWGDEPCNHPFEWMSILGEEFGELCEAVNETCFMNGTHPERGGDKNIIREATQIAAVAIAIIRDFSPLIIPAEEDE